MVKEKSWSVPFYAQKDHVQSYGNMGLAYAILGNRQTALECLDKAIELDPEYEPAMVNRLAVERLKDGDALPDFDGRAISYYSEFKIHGRSDVAPGGATESGRDSSAGHGGQWELMTE